MGTPGPWNEGGIVKLADGTAPAFRILDAGPNPVQPLTLVPDTSTGYIEWWNGESGSPELEFRNDGSQAVRTAFIKWDDGGDPEAGLAPQGLYFAAVRNILGFPVVNKDPRNGTFWLSRQPPIYYPECVSYQHPVLGFTVPGDNPRGFLYATQVRRMQGVGPPADGDQLSAYDVNRYLLARIQVLYETLTYEVKSDVEVLSTYADAFAGYPDESDWITTGGRFVTHVPNPQSMQLTLPQGSLVYVARGPGGGAATVTGSPPRTVPNADVEVTWHQVPRIAVGLRALNPWIAAVDPVTGQPLVPAIEDCLGCVNLTDWNGYQKGTLLLNSVAVVPIRSAIGNRLVDVKYRFAYLPVYDSTQASRGWNCLYWALNPPATGMGFYEVVSTPPGSPPPVAPSNYNRLPAPADGVSIFNFREFRALLRPAPLAL